jgi:hypothetical protein
MCFNKEHTSCCQNDVHGTAILCAKTSAVGGGCCIGGARASRIGAPPPMRQTGLRPRYSVARTDVAQGNPGQNGRRKRRTARAPAAAAAAVP